MIFSQFENVYNFKTSFIFCLVQLFEFCAKIFVKSASTISIIYAIKVVFKSTSSQRHIFTINACDLWKFIYASCSYWKVLNHILCNHRAIS